MSRIELLAIVLLGCVAPPARGGGGLMCAVPDLTTTAEEDAFVSQMRAKGPQGLAEALAGYDLLLDRISEATTNPGGDADAHDKMIQQAVAGRDRFVTLVDRIAGQRGATVSRLYWYADLEQAKAAAAESGKPILSLRMLGKLTDEYSCANSRFFRTALYTNQTISALLRENFVLHWQSVRPVPRITIDFGDGRKLERTITGNSAHYVLDAAGRPLDVLPGLYGPQAFHEWLLQSQSLARQWRALDSGPAREQFLVEYHAQARGAAEAQLNADLKAVAPELLNAPQGETAVGEDAAQGVPVAFAAGQRAGTKAVVENPLLVAILPSVEKLQDQDAEFWARIGALHADRAQLDEASVAAMARENQWAQVAMVRAESKARVENPLLRMVQVFQGSLAADTMRNEYTLHRQVHEWFINHTAGADVDALNERVYAELFLTPSSDPWLGLAPRDAYTALDGGGLTSGQKTSALK